MSFLRTIQICIGILLPIFLLIQQQQQQQGSKTSSILVQAETTSSTSAKSASASTSTSTSTSYSPVVPVLDLSYLHRTKSSLISQAVQEAILQSQSQSQSQSQPKSRAKSQSQSDAQTQSATGPIDLIVDVSASFIGKDLQDLLNPFLQTKLQGNSRSKLTSTSTATSTSFSTQQAYPSFGIIAQRNQWSNKEASQLVEKIVGPPKQQDNKKDKDDNIDTKNNDKTRPIKRRRRRRTSPTLDDRSIQTNDNNENENDIVDIVDNTIVDTERNEKESVDKKSAKTIKSNINVTDHSIDDNVTATVNINANDNNSSISICSSDDEMYNRSSVTNRTLSKNDNSETNTTTETETTTATATPFEHISILDLGWNNLGPLLPSSSSKNDNRIWHKALQRLIESQDRCPQDLRFPGCGLGPAACRAMGKGLMNRYSRPMADSSEHLLPLPISLQLIGNQDIGDPGAAALGAAIRTITNTNNNKSNKQKDFPDAITILERLDLSGCGISDTGAEALAVALQNNPYCIRHLDLSNNHISNEGVAALSRALSWNEDGDDGNNKKSNRCQSGKIETLDLSNNKGIEDAGANSLAEAVKAGSIDTLILRSCHIHADGAATLLQAVQSLSLSNHRPNATLHIDLSGNPLGILRKKTKTGGGKYSASALKSKASATTAAYMNLIGKTVQKGLKDLGIAESPNTLESDDEEEGDDGDGNDNEDEDPSKIKCGAMAMADVLLEHEDVDDMGETNDDASNSNSEPSATMVVKLGLRHCAFDTRASEALAAIRQKLLASRAHKIDMIIDVQMNNVLEDDTIRALRGDSQYHSELQDMAERYLEVMEALRMSRQRSLEAAKVARARMQVEEEEMEDDWDNAGTMGDYDFPDEYDQDEMWDSDADYDDEDDVEDFF